MRANARSFNASVGMAGTPLEEARQRAVVRATARDDAE
jgi:hypothetical protein